jgi:hypothetical protein
MRGKRAKASKGRQKVERDNLCGQAKQQAWSMYVTAPTNGGGVHLTMR